MENAKLKELFNVKTELGAREALNRFVEAIEAELKEKGEFRFGRLGKLKISNRAARVCADPTDRSKKIQVPAKRVVTFKMFKSVVI